MRMTAWVRAAWATCRNGMNIFGAIVAVVLFASGWGLQSSDTDGSFVRTARSTSVCPTRRCAHNREKKPSSSTYAWVRDVVGVPHGNGRAGWIIDFSAWGGYGSGPRHL